MAKSHDVRLRAFGFAVDVIQFCRVVAKHDWVPRRVVFQLVDAAGSVGANLEEAAAGRTKPDFIAKTCIALKEALIDESSEIIAMLVAGIKRARSNPYRGAGMSR